MNDNKIDKDIEREEKDWKKLIEIHKTKAFLGPLSCKTR